MTSLHTNVTSQGWNSPVDVKTSTKREAKGFAASQAFVSDALARTCKAEAFDMSDVLARYKKEQGFTDDVIADHHRELVRFLSLCATGINAGKFYGMMGAIDELWHTFVIFTREYSRFCDQVAGRFMHHVPEVEGAVSEGTLEHYLAFLHDYETVYGEAAPTAYWPRPKMDAFGAEAACMGCKGCNTCTGTSCTIH